MRRLLLCLPLAAAVVAGCGGSDSAAVAQPIGADASADAADAAADVVIDSAVDGSEASSHDAATDQAASDAPRGECTAGSTEACYSGPDGTLGVGLCASGLRTCLEDQTWSECVGEVVPALETCATAGDDDCDGEVNEEGEGCACEPGAQTSCYGGPPNTLGVGICQGGTQTCKPDGTGWGPCEGEVTPQAETCASDDDEDCDGEVNEGGDGCVCVPNEEASCYEGPAGTEGVGLCQAGTKTCNAQGTAWGACDGQVLPATETCLSAGDEDCDGEVNEEGEGCACNPGEEADCYSGPPNTLDVGPCHGGTQTCKPDGTGWGPCEGEVTPKPESCENTIDDDCDGEINEGGTACVCVPNEEASCYEGPAGTQGVGVCQAGTKTCNAQGTGWGACQGQVLPGIETCEAPGDEDCDGLTNEEGQGCVCTPNAVTDCYSGPPNTIGVGPCRGGTQTCKADGTGWGPCEGEVTPKPESCENTIDDDCDGEINEGGTACVCVPNEEASCYEGPAGTQGVGVCQAGTKTCNAQGTGWGACQGQVLPGIETCEAPGDEDCDGLTNEEGQGCVCVPNAVTSCYSGPPSTLGVGPCHAGSQTCKADGTGWRACEGEVTPKPESCENTIDDDCDGQVNEGGAACVCVPNEQASCYDGPAGTQGVGMCRAGSKRCNAQGTAWGSCTGQILPAEETCYNDVDDDCDGATNEGGAGCVCLPGATAVCYSGPPGTAGVGICRSGTQTCNAYGTAWGACVGEVLPQAEDCTQPLDEDCNGTADACGGADWGERYGDTGDSVGTASALDSQESLILAGWTDAPISFGGSALGYSGQKQVFLVKLDRDANFVWGKAWTIATTATGWGINGVVTDAEDNIYIAGDYQRVDFGGGQLPNTYPERVGGFVAKFTRDGDHVWSQGFFPGYGTSNASSGVDSLAIDADGSVVLGGSCWVDATWDNPKLHFGANTVACRGGTTTGYVVKLDRDGQYLWSTTVGTSGPAWVRGVAVDRLTGRVGLTGQFNGTIKLGTTTHTSTAYAAYLAVFDAGGAYGWSLKNPTDGDGIGVAFTSQGEVLHSFEQSGHYYAEVYLYDSTGVQRWKKRLRQHGSPGTIRSYGVRVDADDNVLLHGFFGGIMSIDGAMQVTSAYYVPGSMAVADGYVIKLNRDGEPQWNRPLPERASWGANGIVADSQLRTWVLGGFAGTLKLGSIVLETQNSEDYDVSLLRLVP